MRPGRARELARAADLIVITKCLDARVYCYYARPAKIVWDEPKRQANLVRHGIDFADIDEAFFVSALIGEAKGGRLFAVGRLRRTIVVIFARLGTEGVSILSARPASRNERKLLP